MIRLVRILFVLCTAAGLLLGLVTFTPLLSFLTRNLAVDWYDGDADVVVVLGGSMLVAGHGPQATMGYDSYLRTTYASWMLKRHHYRYIILSGGDGLADSMARLLAAGGTGTAQVLTESSAQTTWENAEFSRKIMAALPGLPARPVVAILTSDYHTRRARLVFARLGMNVRVIPVPDLVKQVSFPRERWPGFLTLSGEWAKDAVYKLEGRI